MIVERRINLPLSISTSGSQEVIAAPGAGKRIAIDHINLIVTSAVTLTFYSATNALSGAYPFDTKQAMVLENTTSDPEGVIACNDNEAFNITLGGAVQVSGFIKYRILNN